MLHSTGGRTALEPLDDDRWRCPRTNLVVVTTPKQKLWRVYKTKYLSSLNPPRRHGVPDISWSRFDIAGGVTLYGASHRRGAFIESLAYAQPANLPLHEIFDDVSVDADPVEEEWQELHHMRPSQNPAEWRIIRRMAELGVADQGNDYYVDLAAAETLGTLRRSARQWAPITYAEDPNKIDIADLAGANRQLTCAAANWLAAQVLADGQPPRGVRYVSKHGVDLPCWAIWVPIQPADSVVETVGKFASIVHDTAISQDDPDLQWAARQLGITVW
jgi:hypothetical protein